MGKEHLSASQAQERKMAWMEKRIGEGGLSKIPPHLTQKQWEKRQDIGITATFGDVSYKELGKIHGVTRERIRQLNEKFVTILWRTGSRKCKRTIPLTEIPFTKPRALQLSRGLGGKSIRVKELIEKGITDPRQIQTELGISSEAMGRSRKVLEGWGIELPRIPTSHTELKEMIAKEDDHEKLQRILDSLSLGQVRYAMYNLKNNVFTIVSKIAKEAGLPFPYRHTSTIVETLKNSGIPARRFTQGKTTCWVMFANHKNPAIEVFNSSPNFQRCKRN